MDGDKVRFYFAVGLCFTGLILWGINKRLTDIDNKIMNIESKINLNEIKSIGRSKQ